jgi:hypothetical protein
MIAGLFDLELYLPPYDPPVVDVMLFWHRLADNDAANEWLRFLIIEAFEAEPLEISDPLKF